MKTHNLDACVYERRGPKGNIELVEVDGGGIELSISENSLNLLDSWRRDRIVADNSSDGYLDMLKKQAAVIVDHRGLAQSLGESH